MNKEEKIMKEYNEMSLEELQKLQEERKKADLITELATSDAARKAKETEDFKNKVIEEYKNSVHVSEPAIVPAMPTSKDKPTNELLGEFKSFTGGKPHLYESFAMTAEDDDCPADAGDWTPTDVFLGMIWHALYDSANLFQIAIKGIDVNAGDGNIVKLRTMGKFEAPTTVGSCECLTCGSASVAQETISILQHGQMTTLCEFDMFSVGEKFRQEYLWAFGQTWGDYFNGLIWTELLTASGSYDVEIDALSCDPSLASASCCEDADLYNIYNGLDEIITGMRVALYKPDYIILHPTIAAIFRRMSVPAPIFYNGVIIGQNGKLESFLGVPVMEYVGADDCSACTASSAVAAVVVDSRRAIGAAFGKPPVLESERNIQCNSTDYVMWSYFGTNVFDDDAIGQLIIA
jgi:hypothetical protein